MNKRKIRNISVITLLLFIANCGVYDGKFKHAMYDLIIVDENMKPLKNVYVEIKNRREKSHGYPIIEYVNDTSICTDENGAVKITHLNPKGRMEYGGMLFLLIPVPLPPKYKLQIVSQNKKYEIEYWQIDNLKTKCRDTIITIDSKLAESYSVKPDDYKLPVFCDTIRVKGK